MARCNFCGKSSDAVKRLITNEGVYICDECVLTCMEIIVNECLNEPKELKFKKGGEDGGGYSVGYTEV